MLIEQLQDALTQQQQRGWEIVRGCDEESLNAVTHMGGAVGAVAADDAYLFIHGFSFQR